MSHKTLSRFSVIGLPVAVAFMGLATTRYPGGYDWNRHFLSTLFPTTTPSGVQNPARPLVIVGMLIFCASTAVLFQLISSEAKFAFHKKTIQIAGIGSMVYAAFTVTLMHNLMVDISLVFFLTAMAAVLHMLYFQRRIRLLSLGILCLAVLLGSAVMYYGNVLLAFLPLAQKMSFASCVGWLFAVEFANRGVRSTQSGPA